MAMILFIGNGAGIGDAGASHVSWGNKAEVRTQTQFYFSLERRSTVLLPVRFWSEEFHYAAGSKSAKIKRRNPG
jgi:hypothetical protein